MSVHGRIEALVRRAREQGYLTEGAHCPSCGWPRPNAPRYVVVRVDGDEEPPQCPECRCYVDTAGKAVGGARTTVVLEGLRLESSRGIAVRDG